MLALSTTLLAAHAHSQQLDVNGATVVDQVPLQTMPDCPPLQPAAAVTPCHLLQLLELATYTDDPNPAVTRILFTPTDLQGRRWARPYTTCLHAAAADACICSMCQGNHDSPP